jgi:hypothetical protein
MLKVNDCSLTLCILVLLVRNKMARVPIGWDNPVSGPFCLSHQSVLWAAVTAARQGVSDINYDGWKTCSSDAVLLESQLKSEL